MPLSMLRVTMRVPRDAQALEHALEGLVALNTYLIGTYKLPHLMEAADEGRGIEYRREKTEQWRNALEVLESGWGDCEDLAAYLAAQYRLEGEFARVVLKQTGPNTLHAQVLRENGEIEDPSVWLGMRPL